MNRSKIIGLIRHVLTFGGGMLVVKGTMDADTLAQVTSSVVTIVGFVWSFVSPEKK